MVFTKAMPAGKDEAGASNPAQRTTFRPPWVKEGPSPLPVPTAPWTLKNARRDSSKDSPSENPLAGVQLRKTSVTTKEPQENGKDNTFKRPQLRPVPPKEETKPPKETLPTVKLNSVAERQKNEAKKPPPIQRLLSDDVEIDKATPVMRNALVRNESMRKLSLSQQAPAPPPMPPPAPAMPGAPGAEFLKPLTAQQRERIEQLKARPKHRPDWTAMLKEIEGNKKLKHVECNDRSEPLLPQTKATEHFVFESEKANVHNELLKQICSGITLKRVKTNDRSKPMLEGLRKFRRQMTIEEQIQKSVSMASMPPEEIEDEADEMDDIDKVRDDLQSTKQMLALELRNKEAQIRENKRLMARILNLEAELEKERNKERTTGDATTADDKLIQSLKKEAEEARKSSEEVEKKYTEATEQLDSTKFQLEELKKQNQMLEKKFQEAAQGKRTSISKDMVNGEESGEEFAEDEMSEESDGEDTEEKKERRIQRELKQLRNKLRNFKNKEDNAKKERVALREIMKKHQQAIKEEKKKYKALQKEVDKMAALMKDVSDDEEEDEEKEESEEEVEEEEEETSSEESETETEDDSESERSQSEPEDAPVDKKRTNLTARSNRHEKILAALKKGNFMMKANAERLQDDLNKQKELTAGLQEDLDSVLAELG
ncbi:troponin T, skeletal muscle-like isoform X2 [Zophobas morio]